MRHKTTTMAGAALALVLLADHAAADCQTEIDQLDGRFRDAVLPMAAHRDVNAMLRAGDVLARSGASDPCDALVAEIDRMLVSQERVVAAAPAVTAIVPVALGPDAPLVDAEALEEMLVVGRDGERLGTIEAVAVDLGDASVGYALVSPARMGVGIKPVPFEALTLALHPDTLRALLSP